MIRRNVASQTIYLPQLVLAADGAAVTSSATLTVAKDGTESASAGTLAHVANGVWKYTPTQGETDCAIVGLVLTGTLAVPVVLNLVTTAADTSAVRFGASDGTGVTLAANQDVRNVSGTLPNVTLATSQPNYAPSKAGDAMTLTSGERDAIATEVESHLLDEGDAQMLINAIVGAIGNTNIDQAILVAAIRADLERTGGNLNTLITRIAGNIRTSADDATAETAQTSAIRDGLFLSASYTVPDNAGIATLNGKIIGTLASGTHQPQSGDAFARLGAPAGASIAADIAAIEGGGGAGATADEIVDELLDRGITAIPVQSGVTSSGNLELVQGDTYNGTAKPLLSFPASTDYTSGWAATLTIRDEDDAVIATASGVVASSTQVTVSLTAPTGLTFSGCPGVWQGKFDVEMSKTTQRATIARGVAYVYEDQTRT